MRSNQKVHTRFLVENKLQGVLERTNCIGEDGHRGGPLLCKEWTLCLTPQAQSMKTHSCWFSQLSQPSLLYWLHYCSHGCYCGHCLHMMSSLVLMDFYPTFVLKSDFGHDVTADYCRTEGHTRLHFRRECCSCCKVYWFQRPFFWIYLVLLLL